MLGGIVRQIAMTMLLRYRSCGAGEQLGEDQFERWAELLEC